MSSVLIIQRTELCKLLGEHDREEIQIPADALSRYFVFSVFQNFVFVVLSRGAECVRGDSGRI